MVALALYSTPVADLRCDGIDAKTIASQLTATETQRLESRLGPKAVVVIDEADLIPVRQMGPLLRQLQSSGALAVLLDVALPASDRAQTLIVTRTNASWKAIS